MKAIDGRQKQQALVLCLCLILLLISTMKLSSGAQDNMQLVDHFSVTAYGEQFYCVVGEMKNIGTAPIGNVDLSITLYNSAHDVITVVHGELFLRLVMPSRKAPFIIMWEGKERTSEVNSYEIAWTYEENVAEKPEELQIANIYAGASSVSGEIQNLGNDTAHKVKIVATWYDENDAVVGAGSDFFLAIPSGEIGDFLIDYPFTESLDLLNRLNYVNLTAESDEYTFKMPSIDSNGRDPIFGLLVLASIILIVTVAYISILFLRKRGKARRKRKHISPKIKSPNVGDSRRTSTVQNCFRCYNL